jgi:Protein of unknown function (DUF3102)
VQRSHQRFVSGCQDAIAVGHFLSEQKSKVGHGKWVPWVKNNLQFDVRTAQRYIKLFKNRKFIASTNDTLSFLSLNEGHKAVSKARSTAKTKPAKVISDDENGAAKEPQGQQVYQSQDEDDSRYYSVENDDEGDITYYISDSCTGEPVPDEPNFKDENECERRVDELNKEHEATDPQNEANYTMRVLLGRASIEKDEDDPDYPKLWCISREVIYGNGGVPIGIFRLEGTAKKKADAQAYADNINKAIDEFNGPFVEFNSNEFLRAVIEWAKKTDPQGAQQVLDEQL